MEKKRSVSFTVGAILIVWLTSILIVVLSFHLVETLSKPHSLKDGQYGLLFAYTGANGFLTGIIPCILVAFMIRRKSYFRKLAVISAIAYCLVLALITLATELILVGATYTIGFLTMFLLMLPRFIVSFFLFFHLQVILFSILYLTPFIIVLSVVYNLAHPKVKEQFK